MQARGWRPRLRSARSIFEVFIKQLRCDRNLTLLDGAHLNGFGVAPGEPLTQLPVFFFGVGARLTRPRLPMCRSFSRATNSSTDSVTAARLPGR